MRSLRKPVANKQGLRDSPGSTCGHVGICGHVDDRRGQSAWPAQHFRPPRLSARPHPAGLRDTCGHSPYAISFGPSAKPICVTCAIVAVVWATVNATPRGLPRLGGHPGHRRGHSAWPAEYSRPFMRPAKLICIACAMLWSTGGLHKASAEPFRVGLALARHRATCAAMWALGKADARSKRERKGIGTARAAQHSRPFGPSARSLRDPTSREKSSAGRGPRCTCGHFGHWRGLRAASSCGSGPKAPLATTGAIGKVEAQPKRERK